VHILADNHILGIALFRNVDVFLADLCLNIPLFRRESPPHDDLSSGHFPLLDHRFFALELYGRFAFLETLRQHLVLVGTRRILVAIDHDLEDSKLTFAKESGGALVGGKANPVLEARWMPIVLQKQWIESRLGA